MSRPQNPDVRRRLLEAGKQLFLAQGFNACGVQELADVAGIPKGSFYSYFETKETFAVAVLDYYWQTMGQEFGGVLEDAALKPLARIEAHFRALSDDKARNHYAHGCLIGNLALEITDGSALTRAKLAEIFERWQDPIAACLIEAQANNEIAADRNPRELAAAIIESWEGAAMRAKVEQHRRAYTRFEEVVLPSLFK